MAIDEGKGIPANCCEGTPERETEHSLVSCLELFSKICIDKGLDDASQATR